MYAEKHFVKLNIPLNILGTFRIHGYWFHMVIYIYGSIAEICHSRGRNKTMSALISLINNFFFLRKSTKRDQWRKIAEEDG